jgi:hypothetical protein
MARAIALTSSVADVIGTMQRSASHTSSTPSVPLTMAFMRVWTSCVRPARPCPSSIFLDKNRRDIGKSQSIWTDYKMETAGSRAMSRYPLSPMCIIVAPVSSPTMQTYWAQQVGTPAKRCCPCVASSRRRAGIELLLGFGEFWGLGTGGGDAHAAAICMPLREPCIVGVTYAPSCSASLAHGSTCSTRVIQPIQHIYWVAVPKRLHPLRPNSRTT